MKQTLTVKSGGRTIAIIDWCDDQTEMVFASPLMTVDVERWLEDGLSEWVEEGNDVFSRTTLSNDPNFLPRLKHYLERQFDFDIVINTEV